MKLILSSLLLFALLGACSAPGASQTPTGGSSSPVLEPADADLMAIAKAYTGYTALNQDLRVSPQHGGIYVRTHLDASAEKTFNAKSFPYAEGAVAVKEGHLSAEGAIDRIYIMKKLKAGYDVANGDWFYAVLSPEGAVRQKGKEQLCIGCHQQAKSRDYVVGF
ncbi:hypothetical protein COW36_15855 [bacterium (Candidatus Blackallbacteria) CG17_big_fil_post_rev_8_21_14_2_50_48_46]|uniref:Cytochrome P460 domain-containing protein n=1 Tax=bacterium (Candidatus Blackallbacteria) CG17_big_fil_post_rev_8_21_14_2_50_48_46 TaxID=2014261 RepID=A0A2M7G221_9BACT|nr:MAG: hypothetical protein COW64_24255 [bacterium (Candidatus Blackallbacteria) CG18_big_fil_WC_8_21_14_2_50_49_26]PIW15816.1 MAG: hypothetical protein COW36_15855 [bacterium (Candidatus Blackallbacteria) CG17_big_fil_post_rev_8_21_14_2_50_48_46]PIW47801.1 MAG: hypothetical protein COW20_11550 [bacterium (Candidatus Blackallbacteria) CG13_big_fil_rev_8_21_14_2_50_49_14]